MLGSVLRQMRPMRAERFNKRCGCRAVRLWAGAGLLLTLSAAAQQQKTELMVDYVPPSLLKTNAEALATNPKAAPSEATHDGAAAAPSRSAPERRRQRFEAEFGIQDKDSSLLKGSIQTAKYKLDETVFAAREFIDSLHYETSVKELMGDNSSTDAERRYSSDSLLNSLETAKFRSGVDWDERTGGAFVGVRLELKFGD